MDAISEGAKNIKANCNLDVQDHSAQNPLNVGDRFIVSCEGQLGLPFKENIQTVFDKPELGYTMVVLDTLQASESSFKLVVTSYQPGDYKEQIIKFSDGSTTVETSPLTWQVQSILNPQQETKPFPSQGPFFMSYPLMLWIVLGGVFILFAAIFSYIFVKKRKEIKLMQTLTAFQTMLSPIAEFSKDLRKTSKELYAASALTKGNSISSDLASGISKRLDRDFRLYLIRELVVPALQVSNRELFKIIKHKHSAIYQECGGDLKRLLSEFEKTNQLGAKTSLSIKECEDISLLSRKTAEKIYGIKRKLK